ncbi:MAG: ribosomal L7Ae/L30e/S12e/Gadd45 family protein [Oscillospiraceae bacterium]|nr:ribosomal L7Ae/L30e/S12e/Gadd45 family protein [Oscillospiraceae bacterium]
MLEELSATNKIVGIKQLRKALADGRVKKVFIACDADPMLTEPVLAQCEQQQITVESVPTMKQLGAACCISVDAAAAAIV